MSVAARLRSTLRRLLLVVAFAAVQSPETLTGVAQAAGLSLEWPLRGVGRDALTRHYANRVQTERSGLAYHSGADIAAPAGTPVFAAASGQVWKIQENGPLTGCRYTGVGSCDHGFGNTIILRHLLADGTLRYTQYSHLQSIDPSIRALCGLQTEAADGERLDCPRSDSARVDTTRVLGAVGQTAFGRNEAGGNHLHFEVKSHPCITGSTPTAGCDDAGPFAYSEEHPDGYGYFDPLLQLHAAQVLPAVRVRVTNTAPDGALRLRVGPGGAGNSQYRDVTQLPDGSEYLAVAFAPGTVVPSCATGWYQLRPVDGGLFRDGSGWIAAGWACGSFLERASTEMVPGVPTQLASSLGATTISLRWLPPSGGGPVSNYVIEVGTSAGATDVATIETRGAATEFTAQAPSAGTFFIRVRAKGPGGIGHASSDVRVTFGPSCAPPSAPADLNVSVRDATVTISWTGPAGSIVADYLLEIGSAPGTFNLAPVPLPADRRSLIVPNVRPGTYYLRLRSRNACGTSAPSNERSLTVGGPAPSNLISIRYDAGVSSSDRAVIEAAAGLAQRYFAGAFGQAIQQPTAIRVLAENGPFTGSASGHTITIYTGHEGWVIVGPIQKTKTVVHELFHVLQIEVGWPVGNTWLLEGAAEWVGYRAQADTGVRDYAYFRECQLRNVVAGTPIPATLQSLERGFGSTPGAVYGLSFMGIDQALNGRPASLLAGLWSRSDWRVAFSSSFGVGPEAFYASFEQARAGWRSTFTRQCLD